MPRRRPDQVRARLPLRQRTPGRPIPRVAGVSAPTSRAIATFERTHFHPGAIARALAAWTRFVHGPIRAIAGNDFDYGLCPCCEYEEPDWNRAILRCALLTLPTKAARELLMLVRPLDELYLTRSIATHDNAYLREQLVA
ncbi:hypothetical protein ACIA8G_15980 [Lentzea sp. NPDC051213]|uniref:hypothetical protein n=1 Tax=Lentzea sp. NPDC051213 TaxID=3364126 RepID=UPI0037A57F0D